MMHLDKTSGMVEVPAAVVADRSWGWSCWVVRHTEDEAVCWRILCLRSIKQPRQFNSNQNR